MKETGVYHKGYQTRKTITTNDPRIIRAFIKIFCFLFLGIGLFFIDYSSMGVWCDFCFNKRIRL